MLAEEKVKTLCILGDLTDAKDNHSAELVNRIVRAIDTLPVKRINILAGNHDWLLKGHEFFKFLDVLPHVRYIAQPWEDDDNVHPSSAKAFFLPYSKNPMKEWAAYDFSHYDFVFMHQTLKGAIASNGQAMEGEDLPLSLEAMPGKIYSGDIHVPQVIGPLEYVGSPYHVHFGDKFKPRCVLLEDVGKDVDLHFRAISRLTVKVKSLDELAAMGFRTGDQVKLRIELAEAEKHAWSAIRREAIEMLKSVDVSVHGVELILKKSTRRILNSDVPVARTPADEVLRFVEAEELGGAAYETAMEIIES